MSPQVQDAPVQELEQEQNEQIEQQPIRSLLEEAMQRPLSQDQADFAFALEVGRAAKDAQAGLALNTPQAAMKIMAGRELGIPPIVSLTGINIIKNKVSMSSALIAALMKRAGYDWRKVRLDDTGADFLLFKNGKPIIDGDGSHARITFTRADADKAGLTAKQGDKKDQPSMYDKYGPDMYFGRFITRFQKRYAPEVTSGIPVYTPDELEFEPVVSASSATSAQAAGLRERLQNANQEKVNS